MRRWLVGLGLALLPGWTTMEAASGPESIASQLDKAQAASVQRAGFVVRFQQEVFSVLRNRTTKQSGRLEFSVPRSFRWEVQSPRKEIYVSNGSDFWKYNESARHAQKMTAKSGEIDFLDILLKPGDIGKNYRVSEWQQSAPSPTPVADDKVRSGLVGFPFTEQPPPGKPSQLLVKLEPKVSETRKAIYLAIDRKRWTIEELRVFFENGNRSRIVFSDFSEEKVGKDRFEFSPPEGTAVDK